MNFRRHTCLIEALPLTLEVNFFSGLFPLLHFHIFRARFSFFSPSSGGGGLELNFMYPKMAIVCIDLVSVLYDGMSNFLL